MRGDAPLELRVGRGEELFPSVPTAPNLVTRWKGCFPRVYSRRCIPECRRKSHGKPRARDRAHFFHWRGHDIQRVWLQRDETLRENVVTRPIPHGLPLDASPCGSVCHDTPSHIGRRSVRTWVLSQRVILLFVSAGKKRLSTNLTDNVFFSFFYVATTTDILRFVAIVHLARTLTRLRRFLRSNNF